MVDPEQGSITIVGLGPAGGELITREAWEVLTRADVVCVRTTRHPAVEALPRSVHVESFDYVYDQAQDFADVYRKIAAEVVQRGRQPGGIVYAVPGDPFIGEATVTAICSAAAAEALPVTIVPGLSFIEPTLGAVGIDGLDGLQLFDAIAVADYNHPPLNPDTALLLGQVYNRLLASELKLTLMAIYPDEHEVALVHRAGSKSQQVENLPLYAIDRSDEIDHLTSLFVPPLDRASSLPALAEAVAVLRGPDGCPWDREQTPQSLRAGFLEEASEVLEALDSDDPDALREELGDVLLHLVMQAQMAREDELFTLNDIIADIYAKIRRRHPHVWGDWEAEGADAVVAKWEAIKAEEKQAAQGAEDRQISSAEAIDSLLDGIPPTLPALARSQKIQERVRRVGFDWPALEGVVDKVREEIGELERADAVEEQIAEIGDVLFALVNWARWLGIDAESALREANLRFTRRFQQMETMAAERNIDLAVADLGMLEALWQEAKGMSAAKQEKEA